ncbi:aryl-sulfate sulfohydrolase [Marinilabilia rubra]|uniref:Aryl-sulfate sulfohydrolase n=2 Tax=Marinilabilia rubra TaxID=2162893 RepID=A0A2U2BBU5_9BACT|nr:aryl-sulfate sulfohydrolase [Marinilabilia rubra]
MAMAGLFFNACQQIDSKDDLPNVVIIHADDLGWKDLGYMGSNFYETPNIDKLASEGLIFTNAYAAAANCAPSRACLMTGQNTPRHGIYTVTPSARGDKRTRKLIPVANTDSINPNNLTLAHLFKKRNYRTCAIGKWHLSSTPENNGFDINIGGDMRGNPGHDGYFAPYNIANLSQGPRGEHLTDRLTSEAMQFIRQNPSKNFFLYLSYYSVHTPIQGKPALVEKYKKKKGSEGQNHPVYAAMVETLDTNVGKLLDEIDQLKTNKETIIIFISDNGGIRKISHQTPLRAGKGSYYEGGIRVPMIIKWDGKIKPGKTDVPVVNYDLFPTIQNILGVTDVNKNLDGEDLRPVLENESLPKRPLIWHFPIYLQSYGGLKDQSRDPLFRTRPGSVIRLEKWKLHKYYEDNQTELYNLKQDPGEQHNLVSEHSNKTTELLQLLNQQLEDLEAPIPQRKNPHYDAEYEVSQIQKITHN